MRPERESEIIEWATKRHLPWYATVNEARGVPELKVHCGCVTAYFRAGDLVRIQADADEPLFGAFFEELAHLFGRCTGNAAHERASDTHQRDRGVFPN